jgi:peptidoglycan L-alanyl-D-glutamate endopeptidase CwlK
MNPQSELLLNTNMAPQIKTLVELTAVDLAALGLQLHVIQGTRTWAEQDALFAKGPGTTKARGGYSSHNFGMAVDMVPGIVGKPTWQPDWTVKDPEFQKMISVAKGHGLLWGGDWIHMQGDFDHFYLGPASPDDALRAVFTAGGFAAVWAKYLTPLPQ